MSLNFKYTTRFACQGSVVDKESDTGKNIALAAKGLVELNPLRKLAPSKEEIASNPDLSYIVFNGAVSSLVNLNHDCIDNETAAKISKSFVNKFIDIEHSRSQCVGVITNAGFSTFKDNQLVTADSLAGNNEPHNMAFCGVIWKFVDSYLHDMIEEAADSESYLYRKISASWELGFNEYCIARGSRNLNQAQIIKDEKEIERLSKYLVCNGGSGFDDTNTEVYRLICGEVVPLGMGLVRKPAASVNGVLPVESDDDENESEDDSEDEEEEEDETYETEAAEKVKRALNKPFRTPGGPKKFGVYVKNDKGNIVLVRFGDPNMEIKRDNPERRKSFRARHNCDNPGPRWKSRYWSCKMWSKKPVSDIT